MARVIQKTIFSGVQPTGCLHLGNYLGAIQNWVKLQNDAERVIFSVVDWHALSSAATSPELLRKSIIQTTATLIACGVNPDRAIIYQQSAVSGHCDLAWILGCLTPMGNLQRMSQYKDKVQKGHGGEVLGLFSYPVLMTADILLYKATHIPVGDDQRQHLELARDTVHWFNSRYKCEFFPAPEAIYVKGLARVMNLRDGRAKMSKSDPVDATRINLTDAPDVIAAKLQRAKTDSEPGLTYDLDRRPEVSNLLSIYAALSNRPLEDVCADADLTQRGTAHFKARLTEVAVAVLCPLGREIQRLTASNDVQQVLVNGARRAAAIAEQTMTDLRHLIGVTV